MSKVFIEEESLTAIGNAIRSKTGDTAPLSVPTGMINAISGISGGGGEHLKTWNKVKITPTFYSGSSSPYPSIAEAPCATLNLSQYINDDNENMWILVCETTGSGMINNTSSPLSFGMFSHFLIDYSNPRSTFYGGYIQTMTYGEIKAKLVPVDTGMAYKKQDRTLFLFWWQSGSYYTPSQDDINNCYLYYLS